LTGLVNGQTYYLLVDGCCGSACDIEISVVGGCGDGDIPNWVQSIVGDDDLYASTESVDYTVTAITNASEYYWYIDGVEISSGENMTTFSTAWSEAGEFDLCVDVSNSCTAVEDLPMQLCKTINVKVVPSVEFELAYTGFSTPVDIANAQDDRLFIVEKEGQIKIIEN